MENELLRKLVESHMTAIGPVEFKNMFGGIGIFHEGKMFAKIGSGKLYLKVDDHNKANFEKAGMKPFYSEKKKKGMPYWEVPEEIAQHADAFCQWALQSIEAANRAAK